MNDIIADIVTQGVDLLISAVILTSVCTMMSASQQLNIRINEQQAVHQEISYYREHNQFDNKEVKSPDIVSAVLKYRGAPYVTVRLSSTNRVTWSSTEQSSPYSITAVSDKIPEGIYKAQLVMSGDVVVGYEFTLIP